MTKLNEKDILMDHNYDGIQELDNDLPPWWLWLFYITIIWSVLYMIHYHVFETGDSSEVEYLKELDPEYTTAAALEKPSFSYRSPLFSAGEELTPLTRVQLAVAQQKEADFLAAKSGKGASQVSLQEVSFEEIIVAAMRVADETNLVKLQQTFPEIWEIYQKVETKVGAAAVEIKEEPVAIILPLTDTASLTDGEAIYVTNCVSCHGNLGQGGIGPNLTDEYYIHGASAGAVVGIINNGVPAKGMISWKPILNEQQILQVTSYILTLYGTDPPNAKAPQGEKIIAVKE
jgi:mono/diheme cytochrome c family protein